MLKMCGVGAAVGALVAGASGQIDYSTVALSGDTAPGLGGPVFDSFSSFGIPVIGATGEIAFRADLQVGVSGVAGDNDRIIYSAQGGLLQPVMREGDPAPDIPGAILAAPNEVFAGSNGWLGIPCFLVSGVGGVDSTNRSGIWRGTPGSMQLAVRQGTETPGAPGNFFNSLPGVEMRFGGEGALAIVNVPQSGPSAFELGLWSSDGGSLQLVAMDGLTSTGGNPINGPQTCTLEPNGRVAFNPTFLNNTIVAGTPGSLSVLAQVNDVAPGRAPCEFSVLPELVTINGVGDVAFNGSSGIGPQPCPMDLLPGGIWARLGGSVALLVDQDDSPPGVPGAEFSALPQPLLNGASRILFIGGLSIGVGGVTFEDAGAMWSDTPGTLELIVRQASPAPGAGVARFRRFEEPAFNKRGDIVFLADLIRENDVTSNNDRGLWAYSSVLNQVLLIARTGDEYDVDDDPQVEDLRTIQSVEFINSNVTEGSGLEDGRRAGLSENGRVALRLRFLGDGTDAIVEAVLPQPPCFGDANGSGTVDFADITNVLANWLNDYTPGTGPGDANGDGIVNFADVTAVLANWLAMCP